MFLSSKSFWSGWRNEAFSCGKNIRPDIPELNVNRSSPEWKGREERGSRAGREGVTEKEGYRLTTTPSVVWMWLNGKGWDA